MTRDEWDSCSDPAAMISHLSQRGCTEEFSQFEDELLQRIRPEVTDPAIKRVIDEGVLGDAQEVARNRVKELADQAMRLEDTGGQQYEAICRQLQLASAILVYDGQGFAETMTELSWGIRGLFADITAESEWQAETLRRLFPFDYKPTGD